MATCPSGHNALTETDPSSGAVVCAECGAVREKKRDEVRFENARFRGDDWSIFHRFALGGRYGRGDEDEGGEEEEGANEERGGDIGGRRDR